MDKRYQVFVSSTYADLREERQKVMQTLMEMDCIPSGMELFPAADEEQFEFIKKVIDDCDYYLLIIGGRYGSVGSDGMSYTEKEYEYALERGIKVIALVHEDPTLIPAGKTDVEAKLRKRLEKFRDKVKTGRLVKFWRSPDELPALVSLSLSKTIKTYPARGWIRAGETSQEDLLNEINELRKENDRLKTAIEEYGSKGSRVEDLITALDYDIAVWLDDDEINAINPTEETRVLKRLTLANFLQQRGQDLISVLTRSKLQHLLYLFVEERLPERETDTSDFIQDIDRVIDQLVYLGLLRPYKLGRLGIFEEFYVFTDKGKQLAGIL